MRVELKDVALPDFGVPVALPRVAPDERAARCGELYGAAGLDWVAVYGDREHAANLSFLVGFDPRFEEALLVLGAGGQRALIVGHEGAVYAPLAGLPTEIALYSPFSLKGQPRDGTPRLREVLRDIGLQSGARVGVAGWKYLDSDETDEPGVPAFVPAVVTRELEQLTGVAPVDVTSILMHPAHGLRARNSAAQIALFEWGAARSSAAVMRVVRGARPGMTELEAAGLMGYQGEPLACHVLMAAGDDQINGLRSPSARRLETGNGAAVGIGMWGGLTCRAGLLADEVDNEFMRAVVEPYYAAIAAWWQTIGIGVAGGEIHAAVMAALSNATFRPMLNPGHLTSYDEWMHSPIQAGSSARIASGMAFQCDIIPTPLPAGKAINCEDACAIADETLRAAIAREHPDVWRRIEARRAFMADRLGLRLRPEVLPLSSAPAYLPPFWLNNELVCTVAA
jgi:hypothetical protein